MDMASRDEKLKKLEERQSQLKSQIQKLRTKEATEDRKRDTRRKVVLGAVLMEMVKSGEWTDDKLRGLLDRKLTRPRDRELFDLAPEPQGLIAPDPPK
jgi:septal ring factor EnvC (AmiA/AmiB activator)